MGKSSVVHYSDGRNAWQVGLLGFMLRCKEKSTLIILTIFSMGALPWWFPEKIPTFFQVNKNIFIFVTLFFIASVAYIFIFYLKKRIIRSLEIKYNLHIIAHDIRDIQTELHKKLELYKKSTSDEKKSDSEEENFKHQLSQEVTSLLKQICENAAVHFQKITGDLSVCAAIRLSTVSGDSVVYKTVARSKKLNLHREKGSEPIPKNEGIPRFLGEEKKSQGILIYNDLDQASKDGTYKKTKNDIDFPDDIKTMMVSPLNAWADVKEDMIGLLYITSRNKGIFKIFHVDSLAFLADLTALSISNTFDLINLKCPK